MSRQLTLDLTTPPAHARADFLPASANQAALAMLDSPQAWPQGRMLLIGPEGAGKTHLAAFWAAENGARRLSAASLRPDAADALAADGGALVVEDADHAGFAAGAEQALFHLWNLCGPRDCLLLMTARRAPRDWGLVLPDLRSRMDAMPQVRLGPPDETLLAAVLVKLFADRQLAVPAGLTLSEDGKTLYVADVFALRAVDTDSGEVTDLRRAHGSDAEYPINVALGRERLLVTSFSTGTLQAINRSDNSTQAMVHHLNAPSAAVELEDGSVLVSELASGKLLQLSGPELAQSREVASGLQGPVQMIKSRSGQIYLTLLSGELARLDPADFSLHTVADGLQLPEGLAELPDGRLLVAEPSAQRLVSIDPETGSKQVSAEQLPIGLAAGPGMPPTGIPTGLAVDAQGRVYFGSDTNNGLYRLTPQ